MTGDHDDRDQWLLLVNAPHRFQPVHARHEDIEKQEVELGGLEDREAVAAVTGGDNAVPGPFQQ
jgi:hypothetical protein